MGVIYHTVGKFRGSKVSHFVSLFHIQKISLRYFILWGMSHQSNYTSVVGVKFCNFNLTTKLTKFKHPLNLPTIWYSAFLCKKASNFNFNAGMQCINNSTHVPTATRIIIGGIYLCAFN